MPDAWPLVGRDRQLGTIVEVFDRRVGAGVVVAGEPGVGKTRLVSEALETLRSRGVTAIWARATSATRAIALGALSPLLGPVGAAATPEDRLHQALDALTSRADSERLVIAVDDAHLLDDTSVALLHIVATQSRVQLLLTMRANEPTPDTLIGLWKDEVLFRLDLEPLSREQTEELVVSVLGDGVPSSVRERIWDLSDGNALFVRELITAARERRDAGGSGRVLLSGPPERRLAELVEERLRLLPVPARAGLEAVAVGEQVPLSMAAEIADDEVFEDLERRNLVVVHGDGQTAMIEVAHPLYGEVLRKSLPEVQRRKLLRALADAAEGAVGFDALRIAVWRLEAGKEDDVDRLVAMAREAAARFDYVLAERLARAARDQRHAQGDLVLGESLAGQGRADEAEASYATFVPATPGEQARWAVARAHNLFWGLSRIGEALDTVTAAELAASGSTRAQLECRSLRAQFLLYSARGREALSLVESVLDHPQAADSARVRAIAAGFALWSGLGHGERINDYGEEWFAVARSVRADVPFGELQLRMTRALALIWTGRYVAAEQFAGADLGLQARHAPPALRGILEGLKGGAAYYRGRMAEAQGRLDASFRALSEGDWFGLRPWAGAFHVRAAVFAGDAVAARVALERAGAAYEANAIRSAFALPDLELSRAWVDAGEGMRSQAVDRCRSLATALDKMLVPIAGDALHAIARLGRPDEVVELLAVLADSCDSRVVRAYADHARALSDDDASSLDAIGHRFEALGADLLAAEAFRSAANRHVASGRGPAAHTAARRCEALLQACGRPASPALEPEALFGEQLTEREREVATLAAQGLMSHEIAERLHLSVRTVDTHLSRAYRKLMVEGRHDLGEALGILSSPRPGG